MLSMYLNAVGVIAPGIHNWHEAARALNHPDNYSPSPVAQKLVTLLPANERRRATRVTQLALYAAQQTDSPSESRQAGLSQCLQVFSSCNGDVSTFHQISLTLAMKGRPVSPTRFHNSVHNAPAGYWSIATQSQTPSTSITAYTDSFSAGLLEAAVQLNASDNSSGRDCLLVCYDEIAAQPFHPQIQITEEFACALRLSQSAENALCKLDIAIGNGTQAVTHLPNQAMEQLRLANPQAVVLPLLDAAASQQHKKIILPYFEQGLEVLITPLQLPT